MTRSVGRVVVSFGMVTLGVKLYLSASSDQVSFSMITKNGNRVKQKLVDSVTGEDVERSETLKGYEYAKDKFVTFTEEEIANMAAEKRDTLELTEFIADELNPLHIEKSYYTGPDKGMDKSYKLLYEILKAEKKAAVGTWVSRGKEHLVILRPYDHGLVMHQMFYDKEVRAFDNTCSNVEISPVEMTMAKILVDQFTSEKFDKSKFSDKFVDKVRKAVDVKLAGGQITSPGEVKVMSSNMTETLRQSLLSMGVPKSKIDEMIAKAQGQASQEPEPVVEKKARKSKKAANS